MPRTYSSIDKIRAELAWVNETPDPNKGGCRNLRCCEGDRTFQNALNRPETPYRGLQILNKLRRIFRHQSLS